MNVHLVASSTFAATARLGNMMQHNDLYSIVSKGRAVSHAALCSSLSVAAVVPTHTCPLMAQILSMFSHCTAAWQLMLHGITYRPGFAKSYQPLYCF